ncbi:MAG: YceI family protein [Saprospiraceae bacterium]
MRYKLFWCIPLWILFIAQQAYSQVVWRSVAGSIHFTSDAPLELIEAQSNELKGILKPSDGSFAFAVEISSFQGFNSALQREHFNENYLESHRYPKATFAGRIIEDVDFSRPGTYTIRAKGVLTVHGIEHERIIRSEVVLTQNELRLTSAFTVPLADHHISIPHIVHQKIAEEINVKVSAVFKQVP